MDFFGTLLVLLMVGLLLNGCLLAPARFCRKIGNQLAEGFQLNYDVSGTEEMIQMLKQASWLKGADEISASASNEIVVRFGKLKYLLVLNYQDGGSKPRLSFRIEGWASESRRRCDQWVLADRIANYMINRGKNFKFHTNYYNVENQRMLGYLILALFLGGYAAPVSIAEFMGISPPIFPMSIMMLVMIAFVGTRYFLPYYIANMNSVGLMDTIQTDAPFEPDQSTEDSIYPIVVAAIDNGKMPDDVHTFVRDGVIMIEDKFGLYSVNTAHIDDRICIDISVEEVKHRFFNSEATDKQMVTTTAMGYRDSIAKHFNSKERANTYERRKQIENFRRIGIAGLIALWFGSIFLVLTFLVSGETADIKSVKSAYFTDYSTEMTMGEALDSFLMDLEWNDLEIEGTDYVVATGGCTYMNEAATLVIVFYVDDETQVVSIADIGIEDQSMPRILWASMLQTIYDNAQIGDIPNSTMTSGTSDPNESYGNMPDTPSDPTGLDGELPVETVASELGEGEIVLGYYENEWGSTAMITTDADGHLHLTADAQNSYGEPVHIDGILYWNEMFENNSYSMYLNEIDDEKHDITIYPYNNQFVFHQYGDFYGESNIFKGTYYLVDTGTLYTATASDIYDPALTELLHSDKYVFVDSQKVLALGYYEMYMADDSYYDDSFISIEIYRDNNLEPYAIGNVQTPYGNTEFSGNLIWNEEGRFFVLENEAFPSAINVYWMEGDGALSVEQIDPIEGLGYPFSGLYRKA